MPLVQVGLALLDTAGAGATARVQVAYDLQEGLQVGFHLAVDLYVAGEAGVGLQVPVRVYTDVDYLAAGSGTF